MIYDIVSTLSTELSQTPLFSAPLEPVLEMTPKAKDFLISKMFCYKEDEAIVKPPKKRKRSKAERKRSKQKRRFFKKFFKLRAAKTAVDENKFEEVQKVKSFWSSLLRIFDFRSKRKDQNFEDFMSLLVSLNGNALQSPNGLEILSPTESFSICGITTERMSPIVTSPLSAQLNNELPLVSFESNSTVSGIELPITNCSDNEELILLKTATHLSLLPASPSILSANPLLAAKEKPGLTLETWPILQPTPVARYANSTSVTEITPTSTQAPDTIFSSWNNLVNESPITVDSNRFDFGGVSSLPLKPFDTEGFEAEDADDFGDESNEESLDDFELQENLRLQENLEEGNLEQENLEQENLGLQENLELQEDLELQEAFELHEDLELQENLEIQEESKFQDLEIQDDFELQENLELQEDFELQEDLEPEDLEEELQSNLDTVSIEASSIQSSVYSDNDHLSLLLSSFNNVYPFRKFRSYTPEEASMES